MERKDYEVEWNARGIDFNYNGSVIVLASDESDARERALQKVTRETILSRQMIAIRSVREIN